MNLTIRKKRKQAKTSNNSNVHSGKKICVVGLGYIGLPTAAVLANAEYQVHGVDVNPQVVDTLRQGKIHIHEPGLEAFVKKVIQNNRLTVSHSPEEADIFIICVPTPFNNDHTPDVTFIEKACQAIRPFVRTGNLIILESTSPPNTTKNVVAREAIDSEFTVGEDVFVAYCPERVLPGQILREVVENDRVVGGVTALCTNLATSFYRSFVTGKVCSTTSTTAEVVKLVENAYRDVNIAFANELSMLADELEVDVFEAISLANRHPRVNILTPGPGVGGHCISVDPWFLIDAAPEKTTLIRTARLVNDSKPEYVVDQIQAMAVREKITSIGCLGITYKADVDDLRESPSLQITKELLKRDFANILVADPLIDQSRITDFEISSLDKVISECELLVLLTAHQEFQNIPPQLLTDKKVFDCAGIWRDCVTEQIEAEWHLPNAA